MKKPIRRRHQAGMLTLDFIFAFTLMFGLTLMLFAMTLSLSVIEITQYITFSVARNYHAAHIDREQQTRVANQKFVELTQANPVFAPLYNNGWFRLTPIEVGPEADARFASEYEPTIIPAGADRNTFVGARVGLNAKVLEMNVPFFGRSFDEEDGFTMKISSFLSRAPTTQECMSVNAQRYQAIRQLNAAYGLAPAVPQAYFVMADNGC